MKRTEIVHSISPTNRRNLEQKKNPRKLPPSIYQPLASELDKTITFASNNNYNHSLGTSPLFKAMYGYDPDFRVDVADDA
jgi:hypothetical protein